MTNEFFIDLHHKVEINILLKLIFYISKYFKITSFVLYLAINLLR